jgi:hypothetical protein
MEAAAVIRRLALGLVCTTACGAAAHGQPVADATAAPPLRAACVLFIDGASVADLPAPVGEVRQAVLRELAAGAAADGVAAVPADDVTRLLGKWRVRGTHGFGRDFLADLAAVTGADVLVVATLYVAPERLQLLVRIAATGDGNLLYADALERDLSSWTSVRTRLDPPAWFASLGDLCRSVAGPRLRAPAPGSPLLVLVPARGVGCDAVLPLTFTHCLLRPLVASGRWRIPDPSLPVHELRGVGVRLDRIGPAGRDRLAEAFACPSILAPEVVVYGVPGRGGPPAGAGDDVRRTANSVDEFRISVAKIDLATGVVDAIITDHAEHGPEPGWFGRVRNRSLLERFHESADSLERTIDKLLEET